MYRRFPFAFPNTPISNFFEPSRRAASRSRLPTTRSSEAFNGRSTTSTGRSSYASDSPCASRDRHSPQGGTPRRQPNRHPDTVSFAGRTAANARTAVVFPVPFSPRIRTPPIEGSTAFTRRPFFRSSWPTIALNGKRRIVIPIILGCWKGRKDGPRTAGGSLWRPAGSPPGGTRSSRAVFPPYQKSQTSGIQREHGRGVVMPGTALLPEEVRPKTRQGAPRFPGERVSLPLRRSRYG